MKADEVIFTLDSTFNDKRFGDMTLKCDSDKVRGRLADGYWYRLGLWYFLTHRYEREHLLQGGLNLKRLIQWDV